MPMASLHLIDIRQMVHRYAANQVPLIFTRLWHYCFTFLLKTAMDGRAIHDIPDIADHSRGCQKNSKSYPLSVMWQLSIPHTILRFKILSGNRASVLFSETYARIVSYGHFPGKPELAARCTEFPFISSLQHLTLLVGWHEERLDCKIFTPEIPKGSSLGELQGIWPSLE